MEEAEQTIKDAVNAGPDGRIIPVGTGATAAIDKFQQIIGVAISPATWHLITRLQEEYLDSDGLESWYRLINERQPTLIIRDRAVELGMQTMRESGVRCVLDGYTTVDEVVRYT